MPTTVSPTWNRWGRAVALIAFAVALLGVGGASLESPAVAGGKAKKKVAAPELTGGVDWLNIAKSDKNRDPIKIEDLKGRVVLLDFWTLCCINCIHVLPDLAKLEAKYPGVLVVIGVHSPKFENEKKTESIRKAILRYEIKHPVINDADMKVWRRYGIRSWPSLVLIDPEGNYYGQLSGEGVYEVLDEHIGKLVKEYKERKLLKEDPIDFALVKESAPTPLYFPGKVLADEKSNRLFIADSTHHRIVITDLDGKKIAIAGAGGAGYKDGSFEEAKFSDPQGMALDGEKLYVADRKNHSIRLVDLKNQTVKTIAGIGEQDRADRQVGGPALKTGLNSPWDLLLHNGTLFIAMAGHHQIWSYDPVKMTVRPYAGNGREDLEDGKLFESSFAQPSGLATDGKYLYVADSEISAIRAVPFDVAKDVKTVVGEGLFEFGDVDGVGPKVRLQHALGVAYRDKLLYVADTYNSKIKTIDPATRTCTTWFGDGTSKQLSEPGGLSFAGDKLYVADTNNHRVVVIDAKTKTATALNLQGVEAPGKK
jgi:DNA-binding beta-propeller fold protein YncE